MDESLQRALSATARFYDARKVGDVGALGFRRSTPLDLLNGAMPGLIRHGLLVPGVTRFLDMGCADGRVSVFMSYLVRLSAGVEVDEWTLDEYEPLKRGLEMELRANDLPPPPDNIHLLHGDTMEEDTRCRILETMGSAFQDFDIFYTYLTMYKEFAELVADLGRPGALYMIYGLDLVLPKLDGFLFLEQESPVRNKIAIYRKL